VAMAAGAHGVHLGANDLPVDRAREVAGPSLLIGATVRDPESAAVAVSAGASYLGAGPAFATATKNGLPAPIGVEGIAAICAVTGIPVIAIGGVTAARVGDLLDAGAAGVAVIGEVSEAPDPGAAARRLISAMGQAPARRQVQSDGGCRPPGRRL